MTVKSSAEELDGTQKDVAVQAEFRELTLEEVGNQIIELNDQ